MNRNEFENNWLQGPLTNKRAQGLHTKVREYFARTQEEVGNKKASKLSSELAAWAFFRGYIKEELLDAKRLVQLYG